MAEILFMLHSTVRYFVLLAGAVVIGVGAARLGRGTIGRPGQIAGSAFVGLLDLQVLLGLGVLATRPFYPALIGHITMMVAAAAVAHGFAAALRRRPPERQTAAFQISGVVLALALVVVGIMSIGRRVL